MNLSLAFTGRQRPSANLRRGLLACLLSSLVWYPGALLAADTDTGPPALDREMEQRDLARLARVQADPGSRIAEFATDGCSGGLSEGWVTLSRVLPAFRSAFGDRPPYESCCTEHDRAYWDGDPVDGYDKRLAADQALRDCVVNYGVQHRAEFAEQFHLSEDIIVTNFRVIGDLMYLAVRAGGKPCTSLPWRWGYGWPNCP